MELIPGPASVSPTVSSLAADFHANTRMSAALKRVFKGHQINYSAEVRQLVAESPLHLDGRERVSLPDPSDLSRVSLETALTRRHSGRWYAGAPISLPDLSALLYWGNGVAATSGSDHERVYRRNVANSGGLGSVEVYVVVMNVAGADPGLYHFDSVQHDLVLLHAGDLRRWLAELVLFQVELAEGAAAFVMTSAVGRLQSKYGPRGYRLGLLDIGHVSENLYLSAAGLGLEYSATAGFIEDEVERALGIDGVSDCAILMSAAGIAWNTSTAADNRGSG